MFFHSVTKALITDSRWRRDETNKMAREIKEMIMKVATF